MHYICEKCGKTFSRSYNLTRHRSQSCVARFDDVEEARRRRLDGAASTSNGTTTPVMQTCAVCNVTVPQNRMKAHERTLEHRSKCCVPVCDGVQRIECAFKNRIASYRINSETKHVDYTLFFGAIKSKVLNVLNELLRVHKSVKVNMVVVGRYFLPTQEIFSEKSFNTANEIVSVGSDLDDVYASFVEVMKVQAAEFQEKDSGMFKM